MLPFIGGRGQNVKMENAFTISRPMWTCEQVRTELCWETCYKRQYHLQLQLARNRYDGNAGVESEDPNILGLMIDRAIEEAHLVPGKDRILFRVDVLGDADGPAWPRCLYQVAAARPKVTFWKYSRAWTIRSIREELVTLNTLPNFHVLASCDDEMWARGDRPPRELRTAWEGEPSQEVLDWYVKDGRPRFVLCPYDRDKADPRRISGCSTCTLCFRKELALNIWFTVNIHAGATRGKWRKVEIQDGKVVGLVRYP